MSLRVRIAVLVAACVLGCAKNAPPKTSLRLDKIEIVDKFGTDKPAPGYVVAKVWLTEDPAPKEQRTVFGSVLEDTNGRQYTMKWNSLSTGGADGDRDPDELMLVFHIPKGATPKSVTVPAKLFFTNPAALP